MALMAAILLAGGVVLYVLLPVLTGESSPLDRLDDEATEEDSRRRVTLLALRDVEYDYVTGKLDELDYKSLRREISTEALEAMDRSASAAGTPPPASAGVATSERERLLEEEIQELRRGLKTGGLCPGCGAALAPGGHFCGRCGQALRAPPSGGDSAGTP
ncbi:MAG: zinc ribbon domain-containing protein [Gemmatimonadota bacterium]